MDPVGLMLNVFLCCIVNIHVLYKYKIDLTATDKCYCDVIPAGHNGEYSIIWRGWGP